MGIVPWSRSTAKRALDVAALIAAVVMVVLIVATRDSSGPWRWVGWSLAVAYFAWATFKKLTSEQPVDRDWDSHCRFFLTGGLMVVFGLAGLGRDDVFGPWTRLLGLLSMGTGIVMLIAERRDLASWRADVERQERDAADQARAAAEAPRPRAW